MAADQIKQASGRSEEVNAIAFDAVLSARTDEHIDPLRPKQFFLDTAFAYEAAVKGGTEETVLARAAGVHHRTVRWYRRIAQLPAACHDLIRLYPHLFGATWAVQLVRRGPSAAHPNLVAEMQQMVTAGRSWGRKPERSGKPPSSPKPMPQVQNSTILALRRRLQDPTVADLAAYSRNFLRLLGRGELIDEKTLDTIERALWG